MLIPTVSYLLFTSPLIKPLPQTMTNMNVINELPINLLDAGNEIKNLIAEKGLKNLSSKTIRKHLELKFDSPLDEFKTQIDKIILDKINEIQKIKSSCDEEKVDTDIAETIQEESLTKADVTSAQVSDPSNPSFNPSSSLTTSSERKRRRVNHNVDEHETEDSSDDLASIVKRRRGVQTRNKRELPRKVGPKKVDAKDNKKTAKKGGYQRVCVLSDELANLLGKRYMQRSEVVKHMWSYFKDKNLKDPKAKKMIILDEPLKKIFGQTTKRIKGFTMMQRLSKHVKDTEFLDLVTRKKIEADLKCETNIYFQVGTKTDDNLLDTNDIFDNDDIATDKDENDSIQSTTSHVETETSRQILPGSNKEITVHNQPFSLNIAQPSKVDGIDSDDSTESTSDTSSSESQKSFSDENE